MRNHLKINRILSIALLATVFLSSCSFNASDSGLDVNAPVADHEDMTQVSSASDNLVSSAVDFDHELDSYKPEKDRYNFYFTYKTVHAWWDAVALGMEDAQKKYLDKE